MNLNGWFTEVANVAPATTRDVHGNRNYGALVPIPCRAEIEINMVLKGPHGEERRVRDRLFFAAAVGEFDRIFIPGDSTSDVTLARYAQKAFPTKDKYGVIKFWEVWT